MSAPRSPPIQGGSHGCAAFRAAVTSSRLRACASGSRCWAPWLPARAARLPPFLRASKRSSRASTPVARRGPGRRARSRAGACAAGARCRRLPVSPSFARPAGTDVGGAQSLARALPVLREALPLADAFHVEELRRACRRWMGVALYARVRWRKGSRSFASCSTCPRERRHAARRLWLDGPRVPRLAHGSPRGGPPEL